MPTIYEIAKQARVSIGTVDRVIHNRGRVSRQTELNIRRIVQEQNYRPSIYARGLALSRTFHFGVLMPQPIQDGGYWTLPEIGIKKALDELRIYGISIRNFYYDKYSHDSFQKTVRSVIEQMKNLDALLIAPVLSKDAEQFISFIPPTIPYVFFDSYIPNASCLSFIGQDSYQSGVLSAKLMMMSVQNDGPVAVLRILPEDYHIEDRVSGFKSFFEKHCRNPLRVYDADRIQSENVFQSVTKILIEENPDLGGIFIPSACAGQVARFLCDNPPGRKIHLIGYDLTQENRKHLENGILDFVISQRPETQGYRGVYSLYRHVVLKEKMEKNMTMPIDIVTKENVAYDRNEP